MWWRWRRERTPGADSGSAGREPGFTPVLPADLEGISFGVADLEHIKTNCPAGVHICGTIDTAGCGSSLSLSWSTAPIASRGDGVLPRRAWEGGVLSKDMDMVSEQCLPAIYWSLGGTLPSCIEDLASRFGHKSPFHHTFFHDAGRRRSRDRWVDGLGGKSGQRWPLSEPLPRWPQLLCLWRPSRRAEEACATRLALG